jgi:UDP-N-acetylmuramoylalanine--D-glutamate ligase
LPGAHNLANVAAAAALAKAFGITSENIRRAIQSFRGVEHRLELVRELDGVRYINDTAATVPEAAIAALRSFDAPIVLIAGGADKRLTFDAFAQMIAGRTKAVVLLDGTATPKLHAALDAASGTAGSRLPIVGPLNNFEAAVRTARDLAAQGDIVLLSPGCASFGMFRNEFHRGEEFRRIVAELESRTEKSRTEN